MQRYVSGLVPILFDPPYEFLILLLTGLLVAYMFFPEEYPGINEETPVTGHLAGIWGVTRTSLV